MLCLLNKKKKKAETPSIMKVPPPFFPQCTLSLQFALLTLSCSCLVASSCLSPCTWASFVPEVMFDAPEWLLRFIFSKNVNTESYAL